MDQLALSVSSFVHNVENVKMYPVPLKTFVKAVVATVPLAVLLHDTSDYWMPSSFNIPIISWFTRKWRQNPETKSTHLRAFRNALIFLTVLIMQVESGQNDFVTPSDYVEQRLTSTTAVKNISNEIFNARENAFMAANELVGEEENNMAAVEQQRDAVLRRRYLQDCRNKK